MEMKPEESDEGSLQGLSEVSRVSVDSSLGDLMTWVIKKAVSPEGEVSQEARVQRELMEDETRRVLLEKLLLEVTPKDVDVGLWTKWLSGGVTPFKHKLAKPASGHERPIQTLERSGSRAAKLEAKIAKLKAQLEDEERQLKFERASVAAVLQYYVTDQLVEIMSPTVAMGPAWTILRALSGYVNDEIVASLPPLPIKVDPVEYYRSRRMAESEKIMSALDHFAGHIEFEQALRSAIAQVVTEFEPRRPEVKKRGGKARPLEELRAGPDPFATADAQDILAALPSARDYDEAPAPNPGFKEHIIPY